MRSDTINSIIEDYIRTKLSPQPDERQFITDKFNQLCKFLKEYEDGIFKNGSWPRYTAIHPVSDLDVVWPLPPSLRPLTFSEVIKGKIDPRILDVSNILRDLAKRLEEEYKRAGYNVIVEAQSHSVGIFFSPDKQGFSIDLVPAIPTGEVNEYGENIYGVPELLKMSKRRRQLKYKAVMEKGENIRWIKTDPKGYIRDSKTVNDLNSAYRKSAKFGKKWNYGCKDVNQMHPLKSFHLELIYREIILAHPAINTYDTLIHFFSNLESYVETPRYPDRADKNRYVDAYLSEITESQKIVIMRYISKAVMLLQRLISAGDEAEVHSLLNDILRGGATLSANISVKPIQRVVIPSGAWSM